ncbi:MAG: hypothetical protein QM804_10325 [Propionicimonas sp.]
MSITYEPLPVEPPDMEQIIAAHLRAVGTRPQTLYGRRFPDTLPVTIGGTTYTAAVIVRDDGGPWPSRLLSVTVLGVRDADYAATRALAAWVASRIAVLADQPGLPIAAVTTVRGPMSVADNPPEFQLTTDLVLVG